MRATAALARAARCDGSVSPLSLLASTALHLAVLLTALLAGTVGRPWARHRETRPVVWQTAICASVVRPLSDVVMDRTPPRDLGRVPVIPMCESPVDVAEDTDSTYPLHLGASERFRSPLPSDHSRCDYFVDLCMGSVPVWCGSRWCPSYLRYDAERNVAVLEIALLRRAAIADPRLPSWDTLLPRW